MSFLAISQRLLFFSRIVSTLALSHGPLHLQDQQHNHLSILASPSAAAAAKSLQSCLTLCDPGDGSPPGFPIPGILQARTQEWVAISFSNA